MKAFKYITAVAAMIGLAACNNDWGDYNNDPNAIRIQATVGEMLTRSNPLGDATTSAYFTNGDKISVKTEDQSAVIYTYNGTSWTPISDTYLTWNKSSHNFYAYYPSTYTGTGDVPTEQNSPELIAAADFMKFEQAVSNTGSPLQLEMQRQTARIVIKNNYSWMNQYKDDAGNVTHEVKSIIVHTQGKEGIINITPFNDGTNYYALVNPNKTENANAEFITVKVGAISNADENTYDELVIRGIPELKEGNNYNCNLTLGKDKAFVSSISVTEWETSTTIWNGLALNGCIMYTNGLGGMCYDIYTPEGLVDANQLIASGGDYAKNVVINLYTDVTLTAPAEGKSNWTPIPVREFNGNNHTIKGLVINNPTADNQALISSGGSDGISNLTLEGCKVKGKDRVAGLIAYGSGKITNCHVKATAEYPIEIESNGSNAGGLAAYVINCEIKDCSLTCETGSTVSIKMSGFEGSGIGGLVGYNTGNSTISNCNVTNNDGTITLSSTFNEVGGLVGSNNGSISGCKVDGVTMSGERYIGGFVGVNNSAGKITGTNTVKNCVVTGWSDSTSATVGSDNGKNTSITEGTEDDKNNVTLQYPIN